MSKARKTIDISELVEKANRVFRDSADEFSAGRTATKLFVEDILMKTGNYKGFRYLEAKETGGKSFGIEWVDNPRLILQEPKFHDPTRVCFY